MIDPAKASRFLDVALDDELDDVPVVKHEAGDLIGHFRLKKRLGEGGFGTVWRAQQTEPIQREVALKIVRGDMDSTTVLRRFHSERQVLARMDHPGIARVYEAGATSMGEPYFAMEMVEGVPIHIYCEAKRLNLKQRAAIFIQVCRAVEHAHQKAVLHRDLKPENILVAEIDGAPTVKIIDFGIAKALTSDLNQAPGIALTQAGLVVGTFDYMAPEQATPGADADDIRVDVYALGVILYQLITGVTPLRAASKKGATQTLPTMLAAIIEHQPLRPSAELNKRQMAGDSLPRGVMPRSAAHLDWVVLKALAKKTADRYSTAGALADELQNYLDDQPLSVGTPGLTTRLVRLASRHRMGFAIGSVTALAAIVISVVTTLAYLDKSRANDLAQHLRLHAEASEALARQEFQHARTSAEFVQSILDEASAQVSDGRNADALRAALAKGEKMIEGFTGQPELQARLQGNLATAYEAMNDIARAVPLRVAQVETLKRLEGPNNESVLTCLYQLACDYSDTSRHRIAAPLFEEIAERYEAIGKADTKPWFEARSKFASMLATINQCQEAVTVLRSLLSRRNGREFGRENPLVLCSLAAAESGANEFEAAHRTLEQALDVNQKSKSSHFERRRATILETLSRVERREGRPLEAAHHTEESLAIDAKERGDSSPTLIGRWFDAGRCYSDAKRLDEALACVDKAEALSIETGAETWRIKCIRVRGEIFMDARHYQESLVAYMQYLPLLSRSNEARPSLEIDIRSTIGTLHSRLHEHAEAMKFALDAWQRLQAFDRPESDPDRWIDTLNELIGIAEAAADENVSTPGLENLTEWKLRLDEAKKIKASQPALPVP